jgi:hypothetical protein
MNWQVYLSVILGILAVIYVIRRSIRQFKISEPDPKCDNCPIAEFNELKPHSE